MDREVKETLHYWKWCLRRWAKEWNTYLSKVKSIQDPSMQTCVREVIVGISQGRGSIAFEVGEGIVGASNIDLEDAFVDFLLETYGEEVSDDSARWVLETLNGRGLGFVARYFKNLTFDRGEAVSADRVVYGVKQRDIVGVMTSDDKNMVPVEVPRT